VVSLCAITAPFQIAFMGLPCSKLDQGNQGDEDMLVNQRCNPLSAFVSASVFASEFQHLLDHLFDSIPRLT
jgi:hypothetical protein